LIRARYGVISIDLDRPYTLPWHCSVMWREMMTRSSLVTPHFSWLLDDGSSIRFLLDPWISEISLIRWPTFIFIHTSLTISITDLLLLDRSRCDRHGIFSIFGDILDQRVLYIMLPIILCPDSLVWRHSTSSRVHMSDLMPLVCQKPLVTRRLAWIWSLPAHPRVSLFFWKLA